MGAISVLELGQAPGAAAEFEQNNGRAAGETEEPGVEPADSGKILERSMSHLGALFAEDRARTTAHSSTGIIHVVFTGRKMTG